MSSIKSRVQSSWKEVKLTSPCFKFQPQSISYTILLCCWEALPLQCSHFVWEESAWGSRQEAHLDYGWDQLRSQWTYNQMMRPGLYLLKTWICTEGDIFEVHWPLVVTCRDRSMSNLFPTNILALVVVHGWLDKYSRIFLALEKLPLSMTEYTTIHACGSYVESRFSTYKKQ